VIFSKVDLPIFVGLNLMLFASRVRTDGAITLYSDSEAYRPEKVVVAG
jgi:hypothetical protein